MSPSTRVLRTIAQVVVAVCVAVPSAVALLDLPKVTTAKVCGIAGAVVIIVTAVQNAVEAKTGKTLGQ